MTKGDIVALIFAIIAALLIGLTVGYTFGNGAPMYLRTDLKSEKNYYYSDMGEEYFFLRKGGDEERKVFYVDDLTLLDWMRQYRSFYRKGNKLYSQNGENTYVLGE